MVKFSSKKIVILSKFWKLRFSSNFIKNYPALNSQNGSKFFSVRKFREISYKMIKFSFEKIVISGQILKIFIKNNQKQNRFRNIKSQIFRILNFYEHFEERKLVVNQKWWNFLGFSKYPHLLKFLDLPR